MQDVIERFRAKANERMQNCYDDLEELWNEFNRELDRRSAIMRGDPAGVPAGPELPNVADGPFAPQLEHDLAEMTAEAWRKDSALVRGEK